MNMNFYVVELNKGNTFTSGAGDVVHQVEPFRGNKEIHEMFVNAVIKHNDWPEQLVYTSSMKITKGTCLEVFKSLLKSKSLCTYYTIKALGEIIDYINEGYDIYYTPDVK